MQVATQAPPPPPPPPPVPGAPVAPVAQAPVVVSTPTPMVIERVGTAGPGEVYRAIRAERTELRQQLGTLEEKRLAIARRLREGKVDGADRVGLEARITELDQRISVLDQEVARADAQVARAAAIPGATEAPARAPRDRPPGEFFLGGSLVLVALILPLSVAWAKRMLRGRAHDSVATPMPSDMGDRFTRIEEAVEAIAIEVERIGEGQRYMTRVLGAGPAEPVGVRSREGVLERR